jgi:hypothetical protein
MRAGPGSLDREDGWDFSCHVDALGRIGGRLRALRLDPAGGALVGGPVQVEDGPHLFAERRGKRR